jgi:hypothetical protein
MLWRMKSHKNMNECGRSLAVPFKDDRRRVMEKAPLADWLAGLSVGMRVG